VLLLLLGLALLAVAVFGALGAFAGEGGSSPTGEQLSEVSAGPGRLIRAYGFEPSEASSVASLANGDHVGVILGHAARCLVRTRDGELSGEACAPDAALGTSQAMTVSDECGAGSDQRMEITALAPEAASGATLIYSDESTRSASVEEGLAIFEGTNPKEGDPYPTAIAWTNENGRIAEGRLPVEDGRFCLPAEEPQ
jgi:hypothetical protein